MTQQTINYSEPLLQAVRKLLAGFPQVREARMFGYPAFFVGQKMFACVYGESLGLKLPAASVLALLERPGFSFFQPMHRRRMREWVQIERKRPADHQHDRALLAQAVAYAATKSLR